MDSTLATINPYLARAVFTVSAVFAVAVTLLATFTGERILLIGTAFGVVAGGYAMQVARSHRTPLIEVPAERTTVAA